MAHLFRYQIDSGIMKSDTVIRFIGVLQLLNWLLILHFPGAFAQPATMATSFAETSYFDSLKAADEQAFQREFEFPFLALLDATAKNAYLKFDSIDKRKSFIISYWLQQQPNPLSPRNELLEAFLERWNYVRQNFPSSRPPFFDDRGQFYLKYGEPSVRVRDSGGRKTVSLFKDRQLYLYLSQLYSGFPPAMEYFVHPNESWAYRELGPDFVVHFVKQGDDFRQVSSLSQAIESGITKNLAWYWSDLIQSRAHLGPSFARAANQALEIQQDLLSRAFTRSGNVPLKDHRLPHERLLEQKKLQEIETMRYRGAAPNFFVPIREKLEQLDFSADVAQFRGENDSTWIEVHALAPLHHNLTKNGPPETITIEYNALIRDQNFSPVRYVRDTCRYSASFFQQIPNAIGRMQFSVPALSGDLTLQLQAIETEKIGYIKQPIIVRDFSAPRVMISDIQIYFSPEKFDDIPESLIRTVNNVPLIPYPFEQIQKQRTVFCYFEIYNIKTAAVLDQFKIKLELTKEKSGQGILKRTFRWLTRQKESFISLDQARTAMQDKETELIELDLSKLLPGDYSLKIAVSWDNDPKNIVSVEKRIKLKE